MCRRSTVVYSKHIVRGLPLGKKRKWSVYPRHRMFKRAPLLRMQAASMSILNLEHERSAARRGSTDDVLYRASNILRAVPSGPISAWTWTPQRGHRPTYIVSSRLRYSRP